MILKHQNHRYLQKFDVAFILRNSVIIPRSLKKEFDKWSSELKPKNTRDKFTFIGPFVNAESIMWLDMQKYLVSYNDYFGMPIKAISKEIRKEQKELGYYRDSIHVLRTNTLDTANNEPLRATRRQAEKIEQHLAALELLRDHLEGKIQFIFPDGYEPIPPQQPKAQNQVTRLLERLFGHYRIP